MKPEERLAVCGLVNLLLTHRYTQASRCMCVVYLCIRSTTLEHVTTSRVLEIPVKRAVK
jgi:hypothetical protein